MTHFRTRLIGLSALVATLAGCATAPPGEGGTASFPARMAAPHPGPGWLLLGSTDDGAMYMHPRSTLRVGSSAFIMLVGTKSRPVFLPGGAAVGSIRERIEIDCDRRRYRRYDGTAHPDNVALGPVLGQVGQAPWKDVPSGTLIAAVSSAVCSATAPDSSPPGIQVVPPEPAMLRFPTDRRRTFTT